MESVKRNLPLLHLARKWIYLNHRETLFNLEIILNSKNNLDLYYHVLFNKTQSKKMSIVKKLLKPFTNQLNPAFTTSIYRKDPVYNFLRDFAESDMVNPLIHSSLSPLPVDVKESEKEYELIADIPGFTKNEINCMIDEDKHLLT